MAQSRLNRHQSAGVLLAAVGVVAGIVAVLLGVAGHSVEGQSCGSVFAAATRTATGYAGTLCGQGVQISGVIVWVLVAVAIMAITGGVVLAVVRDFRAPVDPDTPR